MAKNTKKKAKFKEVTFTINKGKFKELLEQVLKNKSNAIGILNGVKMTAKRNFLTLVATDGILLVEVQTQLDDPVTNEIDVVMYGKYLEKMVIKKDFETNKRSFSLIDFLEITVQENKVLIVDTRNQIKYNVPIYNTSEQKYPECKKLFKGKKDDSITFGVNIDLLSRLKGITKKGIPSKVTVSKDIEDPIEITAQYGEVSTRALVMPCIIRE